jgi:hypothetical protein
MTDLTDIELLTRIDLTRSAIAETERNLVGLKADYDKLLEQFAARKGVEGFARYRGKLERLYNFVTDFTCSAMPKKTASYRFVPVATYREACGMARPDPLEYRIDEENDVHMTVTFFVSSERLQAFITKWWQRKFKNLAYVQFNPDGHDL